MSDLKKQNPYIRLFFVLGLFALSIGDAFNVLFVKEMAEGFVSPDKLELYTSIPITAMSAMMILGVISANIIVQKSGNIIPFFRISAIVTALGMLLRGVAFHYYIMLIGFMAVGFGYGCFYIGIRFYAYLFDDEKERMETLASISGGSFAGQCMGTVLGGIMAGQMPYRVVYLISVAILVIPLLLLNKIEIKKQLKIGSLRHSFKVFKNKRADIYLLFMVLPLFACTIFTSYTVPLEADRFGFSSTVISALLLGSYLISAYAGPFMTRLVVSNMSALKATFVYCIGAAFLIAVYSLGKTFPLLVLVVLMLGLMDAFGPSVMTEAYTDAGYEGDYGDGEALIIYILFTRLGMTIAPGLILAFGTTLALSGVVIIGMVLFLISGTILNMVVQGKEK
ncbi:MAG: MFS transporter [Lachnospiraceae bacterium]|nr:MFS transporter [Lachnospiraceae bacterium]